MTAKRLNGLLNCYKQTFQNQLVILSKHPT